MHFHSFIHSFILWVLCLW